jgi:hypothetical protein
VSAARSASGPDAFAPEAPRDGVLTFSMTLNIRIEPERPCGSPGIAALLAIR